MINFNKLDLIKSSMQCLRGCKNIIFIFASILFCGYLFYATGLHGDDMSVISDFSGMTWTSFFDASRAGVALTGLGSYYLFWWAYVLVGLDAQWLYDAIKWLSCIFSIIFVYRFALDYLPVDRALLAASLFVFNPAHEVTMYWYMTATYVLTPAIIMLSHHYVRHEKYRKAIFIGSIGSFMGYVSPPYGIGLAIIFVLEKAYKKSIVFILPSLLYILYYFLIFILYPSAEQRIHHGLSIDYLAKNYLLQIPAFFDSLIGPSFWLKIYYAINAIKPLSLVIAILCIVFLIKNTCFKRCKFSLSLFGGLVAVLLVSFGCFAIADILGHRAFNLGDRLSVYGSLLIAFLVAFTQINRGLLVLTAICFILPTFGLSDHWKSWNANQIKLIEKVKNNQDLKKLNESDTLLVADNMYSKLGPFSHIDFFSMPWNVDAIFKPVVKSKIIPLNTYIYLKDNRIIDDKSNVSVEVSNGLYLYQSGNDKLIKISLEQLPKILANRPVEIRHWIQIFKGSWVANFIEKLSPRFSVAFNNKDLLNQR